MLITYMNRIALGYTGSDLRRISAHLMKRNNLAYQPHAFSIEYIDKLVSVTAAQLEREEQLVTAIREIYNELRDLAFFRELIATAGTFLPTHEAPVFKEILSASSEYALSLIGIHQIMPIPVHDHPQTSSVQLVLQGQLRVRKYRLVEVILDPALVKLERLSESELHPGSTTTTGELSNNIHGLQAISKSAVVLSLQVPPCVAKKQAWYFSADPFSDMDQSTIWNRITKHSESTGLELVESEQYLKGGTLYD